MATKKRTGLGRGISSLIPAAPSEGERPVDMFFNGDSPAPRRESADDAQEADATAPSSSTGTATTTRTKRESASARAKSPASASDAATASGVEDDAAAHAASDAATGIEPADALLPVPGARLIRVAPTSIVPNAWQPRHEFDEDALEELTHSIREFGVLQPVVVRHIPDDHPLAGEAEYELIMGERRLRATKAAGLDTIPAILKDTPDDDMLRDALLENLHRSELNPLEEASAYQQLLDDFGITQEQLAQRIGRSRPQISNTLRLLKLPIDVQRRVAAGVLSAGHARAILSAGEPSAMSQLADKIVNEDLSVRAAEAAASNVGARRTASGDTAQRSQGGLSGYLDEVGEHLGDRLNTRVKVSLRRTKGQIVIDFASIADLNRILVELGEDLSGGNKPS